MASMIERGQKPQVYQLLVMVGEVTIHSGEHQNIDPTARICEPEAVEENPIEPVVVEKEVKEDKPNKGKGEKKTKIDKKKKAGKKEKGKKEKKGKGKKEKKNAGKKGNKEKPATPIPEPPAPPQQYKLLPPFSLGFRLFQEETLYVQQIALPLESETRSDMLSRKEELNWKLPNEKWFGRGLSVVVPQTADNMSSWLQSGALQIEVCRWRGYGEREMIGLAKLCLPSRLAEASFRATNKGGTQPLLVQCEGVAVVRDVTTKNEIGTITTQLSLTCFGDYWMSGSSLSYSGITTILNSCPADEGLGPAAKRQELEELYELTSLLDTADREKYHRQTLRNVTLEDILCSLC